MASTIPADPDTPRHQLGGEVVDLLHAVNRRIRRAPLDAAEMDPPPQRGIDHVRETRAGAMLQPAAGGYKVYILDEAHQLTPSPCTARR